MKTAHNQEIKEYISLELLLETILNYGDQESVKKLLELMGIDKASEIFNIQISNERDNYFAPVKNFFQLYFNRHAQGNIKLSSNESTCFGRNGKVERLH